MENKEAILNIQHDKILSKIWVDADACPKVIKEVLVRAAKRTQTLTVFVANQLVNLPSSPYLKKVQVDSGFDVADNYIVTHVEPGQLVVTADIPLADSVISNKGRALNFRGELYTASNIKQRLAVRDLCENLRSSGIRLSGPATLHARDIQRFANCLDGLLAGSK